MLGVYSYFRLPGGQHGARPSVSMSRRSRRNLCRGRSKLMLQSLLRDRFQLVVRKETREMPVYHLVLARKDGKLGLQLKESACRPYDREHPPAAGARTCGSGMSGGGKMDFTGAEIPNVAANLSTMLERTI